MALKKPGALAGLLLYQVRRRLQKGAPEHSDALRRVDLSAWAATCSELKDIRDLKEVQLLSRLMVDIGEDRLPQAMDLAAQRVREIRLAKSQGGSWEKAAAVTLMPAA
eukprot:5502431-Lingulodinium_polyedra.AAC.1